MRGAQERLVHPYILWDGSARLPTHRTFTVGFFSATAVMNALKNSSVPLTM